MTEKKTIQMLQHEYQEKFLIAMSLMHDARKDTEIDFSYKEVVKAAAGYRKALKQYMKEVYNICCSDQAKIMKFLNDHFNLDPDKCQVEYDIMGHTVKWTITLYQNKEKYWYIANIGRPIDMDKFYDWSMKMLT